MAMMSIDLNRGAMCCRDKLSGMYVYMYIDQPGVYLSEHGAVVSPEIAKLAGFDVAQFEKARKKAERLAQFVGVMNKELEEAEADEKGRIISYEKGGWTVQDIGIGHAHVVDPEGNKVTAAPINIDAAKLMVDKIVGTGDNTKAVAAKKSTLRPLSQE